MLLISCYDFYILSTEIYLLNAICALLVYGVILNTSHDRGTPAVDYNIGGLCTQVLIIGIWLTLYSKGPYMVSWSSLLVHDFLFFGMKSTILIISLLWSLTIFSYNKIEKINFYEYWIVSMLAIVAMLFIGCSYDFLSMYLSIEFQSIAFYILASFKRTSEFSTEAGLKYFILGAFSSALLLLGISLLYGITGLTNFGDLSKFFLNVSTENFVFINITLFSIILIEVALLFKISAAPFHMWSPDVYEGASTNVTSFFGILPKLALVSLMFRLIFLSFSEIFPQLNFTLVVCAVLSMVVGTFGALMQMKWKRFIAYSTISHIGFILAGFSTLEFNGAFSALFYILVYVLTSLSTFAILLSFRCWSYPTTHQLRYLTDISGLVKVNPVLASSLVLILFSMAGIPPFPGFFAKAFVLLALLQEQLMGLALIAISLSCIACFYYIRLIQMMYFSHVKTVLIFYPIEKEKATVLSFNILLLILLFFNINLISNFVYCMLFL
uniref:NADH dehydrogenase subunit 2 n=1 Tax=Pyropia perforata TaxID=182771 RepID=A0A059SV21_PYRPE|nr:NADH dehydrogenase subunit 2 [Neoporphyra perforata]AHB35392.1 NADH dehydrogenase subunit 2 [Neoporphyra perforata]AHB35421.1 NADH dehydrogenase subunit 2 [Neoporphyra perforata]AIB08080.1 NADH dehydrogenase subunit 2 [Neoporphyra perforata]AIB08170.1 NADH dehydrogenase subunit 2 [Neoporphyra perforata]